jgi:ribosomal protein L11 methyltransferase
LAGIGQESVIGEEVRGLNRLVHLKRKTAKRSLYMFYRLSPDLVIRSAWRPYLARRGERVLVLKTSGVFPPAHPTTRLCLELLTAILAAGPPPVNLLDVGCGSGILLLAAAALGVTRCLGVDLSRQAAHNTLDHARRHALTAAVRVLQGSTECLRAPFAMILANLPWEAQRAKAPEFWRLAAPAGWIILSGFKDTQEEELLAQYRRAGWLLEQRLTRDEWVIEPPPEKSYTWVAWLLRKSCESF